MDISLDSLSLEFTDCPSRLACEDLVNKEVDDISGVAYWLKDMELIRSKFKNINGRLSGYLKDRIVCIRSIIKILVDRIKDSGDVSYLRRRNDELSAQIRESRKEEARLQSLLKEADIRAEKLSMEVFELRRRIGSKSTSVEPERPPLISAKDRQGTPGTWPGLVF